jgi:hypothetical protein
LDDTDPVCGHHHDLKTYKNWQFVAGRGRRPMVPPDHPHHPDNAGPPGRDPTERGALPHDGPPPSTLFDPDA